MTDDFDDVLERLDALHDDEIRGLILRLNERRQIRFSVPDRDEEHMVPLDAICDSILALIALDQLAHEARARDATADGQRRSGRAQAFLEAAEIEEGWGASAAFEYGESPANFYRALAVANGATSAEVAASEARGTDAGQIGKGERPAETPEAEPTKQGVSSSVQDD